MKKIIFMFAAISLIAFTGNAQNTKPPSDKATVTEKNRDMKSETPEQRAQQWVDKLDKTVTLTADQKTQVTNLALTRAKNVEAIRVKYKGQADKQEVEKQEIKAAQKEYQAGVEKILTADQIQKLEATEKANKANDKSGSVKEQKPAGNK